MCHVPTPVMLEEQKNATSGKPIHKGPCVARPHCDNSFIVLDRKNKPAGLCHSLDAESMRKGGFQFESPIFACSEDLPKRSAKDIKAKAMDPYTLQMNHFAKIEALKNDNNDWNSKAKRKPKAFEDWSVPASYDYAEFDGYSSTYWHERNDYIDNSKANLSFSFSTI